MGAGTPAIPPNRTSATRRSLLTTAAIGVATGVAMPWHAVFVGASPIGGNMSTPATAWGAETTSGGFSPAGLEQMHETMAGLVANGMAPGLVTLISRDGEIHADAIGAMALDGEEPMRRDTIFRSPRSPSRSPPWPP